MLLLHHSAISRSLTGCEPLTSLNLHSGGVSLSIRGNSWRRFWNYKPPLIHVTMSGIYRALTILKYRDDNQSSSFTHMVFVAKFKFVVLGKICFFTGVTDQSHFASSLCKSQRHWQCWSKSFCRSEFKIFLLVWSFTCLTWWMT